MDETALTTIETSIVKPIVSAKAAVENWHEFQTLKVSLLEANDYQDIQGKKFIKKGGWRKIATVFNLADAIVSKQIDRDDSGKTMRAEFTVRVTAPNGRYADGWGCCSVNEGRQFNKVDHDIPATAHTRAKNRAISDLVGGGEVSAEEMQGGHQTTAQQGKKEPAKDTTKPLPGAGGITDPQNRKIQAMCKDMEIDKDAYHAYLTAVFGRAHTNELTKKEASEVIEAVSEGQDRIDAELAKMMED